MERHEEAFELACDLVRNHPRSVSAHLEHGRALYQRGRLEESLGSFTAALGLDPHEYQALFNLGALHFELGNLADAEDFFLKAIALDTSRTEAQHNLALLWFGQSRLTEADEMLRALLSREPNGPSFALLGQVLLATGHTVEAVAAFERSLEMQRAWAVRANLAEALARCFRYQEALDALRIALAEAPEAERAALQFMCAQLAMTSGNQAEAVQALKACLAADPSADLGEQASSLLDRLEGRVPAKPIVRTRTSGIWKGLFSNRGVPAAR